MPKPKPKPKGKKEKFLRSRKPCKFCKDGIDYVDYKDEMRIKRFMTDRGKITPRRITGTCAWHQPVIAAAIKLTDGGPVFFTQERVGKGGRAFESFKFRSMVPDAPDAPDADAKLGTVQATECDPRVTPVGRLLRTTAMDELPQLWNIFRGDMSFVGPRALATSEVEVGVPSDDVEARELRSIPGFAKRHTVTPGLTGIAQIYAPRDVPRRHKFRYDRIYVDNSSFWLDLKLICLSFWITFRGKWEVREKKL